VTVKDGFRLWSEAAPADKLLLPFMPADASSEGIAAMVGMLPLIGGITSPLLCCEGTEPSIAVAILNDPDALGVTEPFVAAA
jgi:hypothetical protein